MEILQVNSVSKKYGQDLALDNFTIQINKGEIVALLGPNGAGKTTLVKSILGHLNIDSGEIVYFSGITSLQAREKISYMPEKFTFYPYFTIFKTLEFYAKMYNVPNSETEQRIKNSLELLNISEIKNKKLSDLSKGQLQRVGLACAVLGDHELIILDEPFSGLDPIGMKEVKDIFKSLKSQGKTLLINSHILAEMEKVADTVIILNKGKTLAMGPIDEVRKGKGLEDVFFNLVKGASNV